MSDIILNNMNNEIINYENNLIKDLTFFNEQNEYILELNNPNRVINDNTNHLENEYIYKVI
jgi:hypothetical protein